MQRDSVTRIDPTVPEATPSGSVAPVQSGQILAGKYRVEEILGVGGMGVVVAARHIQLDELVALKFLLPEALGNPEVVARFGREARAAVKIKSEHVARVIDVGVLDTGAPFLVMEHLKGNDLAVEIQTRGPLPISDVAEYVLQVCEALAEAHGHGIVHRDLKPANLFLARRPDGARQIKILDFGISKAALTGVTFGDDMSLTRTTTVMGSPLYMSPEQMRSARDVDHRTDIWALGVVLYELLTGRLAFHAETITQLCASVLQDEPERLTVVRPDASPELERVVLRCLEKKPADRFQNIGELAVALLPFAPARSRTSAERSVSLSEAAGMSTSSPELTVKSAIAPAPGLKTMGAWDSVTAERKGKWPVLAIIAAAGLVVVVGGAFLLGRGSPQARPPLDASRPEGSAGSVAVPTVAQVPTAAPSNADPPPPPAVPARIDGPAAAASSASGASAPRLPAAPPKPTPAPKPRPGKDPDVGF